MQFRDKEGTVQVSSAAFDKIAVRQTRAERESKERARRLVKGETGLVFLP